MDKKHEDDIVLITPATGGNRIYQARSRASRSPFASKRANMPS